MKLEITSVSQDKFGRYEVTALVDGKEYIYYLSSEYDYRIAMKSYRRGHYGKCLNILKKRG